MSKAIEGGTRSRARTMSLVALASGLTALGCASGPPPAAEAPAPVTAPPAAELPAAPAEAAPTEDAPKPEAAPAPPPEPEPEPSGPTRPATEVITEADTDFLIDDGASALKEAARQKCESEAPEGTDPAALAACRQKERDAFGGDILSFQAKEDNPVATLVVYRRKGTRLDEVYRAPVVLKDQSPTTVLVTPKGFKGARPFMIGAKEFSVEVPDNYTLVIQDPTLGKLVYHAKVGVVARP